MMTVEAVVMVVVVMVIELGQLNVFRGRSRCRLVNGLQKRDSVRNRLQQIRIGIRP